MQARGSSSVALAAETYFLKMTSIDDAVTSGHTVQPCDQMLQGKLKLQHSWRLEEQNQQQRKRFKTWMFKYKLGDKLVFKRREY